MSIARPALYVVATPIGNLGDISLRGIATLIAVDLVLSEDTRHSRRLFEHYGIATPLSALHEHNEARVVGELIERLCARSHACALISDAGTPLISDPGYLLVRAAHAAGVPVFTVPGACAAIAALSVSGIPTDRFVFEGFLPSQAMARAARLETLAQEARTLMFYEAPHRILECLAALRLALGSERAAVIARELTKRFETVYHGTLGELEAQLAVDADATRGEIVIIVAGSPPASAATAEVERLLRMVLRETDRRSAVRIVAALRGHSRNQVYQASLALQSTHGDIEM